MPRFFLHIRDGNKLAVDEHGSGLLDLEAALERARQGAREIIAIALRTGGQLRLGRSFEIADGEGRVVATLSFTECLY
jgi:hypothetical protein